MPTYRTKHGWMHIKMTNTKKHPAPAPCAATIELEGQRCRCAAMSTLLCDWPVADGTCDMPLCPDHGTEVGKDRHYCPKHAAEHAAHFPPLF